MWRLALYLLLTLCGIMYSGAILGGRRARDYEFPYVVYFPKIILDHDVGLAGSLITPRHVLTVAHAFRYSNLTTMDPKMVKVVGGATYIGTIYNDEWSWGHDLQIRRTQRIVLHEDFRPFDRSLPNDIAVVTVTREFYMSRAVQLARLPAFREDYDKYEKQDLTVAGYGRTQYNVTGNKYLNTVVVKGYRFRTCERLMTRQEAFITKEQNLCGIDDVPVRNRSKNTCWGDDGGPLVFEGTQIGLVFWPICSRRFPGVYVRVDNYIDWIKDRTRMDYIP